MTGGWSKGYYISAGILALMLTDVASAKIAGRTFGDFNLSGGYDDSVLRDASHRKDGFFPLYAGLGWRGRLTKTSSLKTYYRFTYRGFIQESQESYQNQLATVNLRQKLYGPVSLKFNVEGEFYRQPGINQLNSRRFLYKPGFEINVLPDTALRGFFLYESETYPNYDLDWKGPGLSLELDQDIAQYGNLFVQYTQRDKKFRERKLFLDTSGALRGANRNDDEKELEAVLEIDKRYLGFNMGFNWSDLDSDGNLVDFGPNQSSLVNTVAGDERLIDNYYSYTAKGPFLGVDMKIPHKALLSLSNQWQDINFHGRLAKNNTDNFLPGDSKRSDDRQILSISITRFRYARPLTLAWTFGWSREKSKSTDTIYSFNNNRFFLSFRGWF